MGGLLADQVLAVGMLEQDFVAGRDVDDQLGAGDAVERRRRERGPEILADLDGEGGVISDPEEDVRRDVAPAPGENDFRAESLADEILAVVQETAFVMDIAGKEIGSRGEPAGLVEFVVGRVIDFRDDALDLSVPEDDGAVVQFVIVPDRGTDDDGDFFPAEMVPDGGDRRFRTLDQEVRAEKVPAGIACHGEFREDQKGNPVLVRTVD